MHLPDPLPEGVAFKAEGARLLSRVQRLANRAVLKDGLHGSFPNRVIHFRWSDDQFYSHRRRDAEIQGRRGDQVVEYAASLTSMEETSAAAISQNPDDSGHFWLMFFGSLRLR